MRSLSLAEPFRCAPLESEAGAKADLNGASHFGELGGWCRPGNFRKGASAYHVQTIGDRELSGVCNCAHSVPHVRAYTSLRFSLRASQRIEDPTFKGPRRRPNSCHLSERA